MSIIHNRIFDEALSLPVEERISLVEQLLLSLNLPQRPDIEQAWREEAERRVTQIEQGEEEEFPIDDVLAMIKKRYKR